MSTSDDVLRVYRDLADYHERQGLDELRDRFLVLAAAAAQSAGHAAEAERLRQRLLTGKARHLLGPFPSMAQAMNAAEVQTYLEELRQEYPLRAAEDLLASSKAEPTPNRHRSDRALPPTAPVIDLDNLADTLKVYAGQEEREAPTLPAWQEPPRRKSSFPPTRPIKTLPSAASARPATIPVRSLHAREETSPPRQQISPRAEDIEEASGRWVCFVLFAIVLAAGLYLAGFTILRPFLP